MTFFFFFFFGMALRQIYIFLLAHLLVCLEEHPHCILRPLSSVACDSPSSKEGACTPSHRPQPELNSVRPQQPGGMAFAKAAISLKLVAVIASLEGTVVNHNLLS